MYFVVCLFVFWFFFFVFCFLFFGFFSFCKEEPEKAAEVFRMKIIIVVYMPRAHFPGWFFFTWGASCYNSPPVGCFPTTSPFSNSGGIVPQDPQVIPTYFNSYRLGMGTEIFTSDNAQEVNRFSILYRPIPT